MKTFTNCAEKKAKQLFNLLQGYTKGIRMTAILILLLMGVSNMWAFTKGEVLFIYTDNGDAAWKDGACVKLWFNDNGNDKGVASTQWLSDYDDNHKLFYAIVPGDGANKVQLQRFDSNCSTWWNACGDALQSSRQDDAYNTFYSIGAGNSDFGWKNETFEMYLYGAPNNWASSLGTFAHQGNGVYKYTYRYKTTATSLEFKLKDSKSKWHGNNVNATGLTVGKTYDLTGTVKLANGMTLTMAKSVVSFPVTFASKGTFGSSKVTAKINSTTLTSGTNYESGQKIVFTASPASGYEIVGWYSDASCTSSLNNGKNTTYTITSLDADASVYVKFQEKQHNVTVSYKCGEMTLKNNTTLNNVGEITTSNIYKDFITGFTFSGWTLGTGVTTTSNSLTSESININTLPSGNYTLTANYTENSFAIRGGGQFGNTWDVSHLMTKQNASERIVYCTIPINQTNTGNSNTDFCFKAYDSNANQWYGLQAQDFTAYYYNRNAGELRLDGARDAENIELRADVIGNYIFKIDYSDPEHTPKITVTYPDGCFLCGDFNNWKDTHSLLESPVTITLTKGDHQFKVHRYDSNDANDYWCGNTGIMTRDGESVQSGGWVMSKESDNCTLTADIPGNYTFTYDRSSGKMTVSYPEKHTVTLEGSSCGTFVVKCDNYHQTSSTSRTTLDVPAGATITITDIRPHNDGYDQTMVYSTGDYIEFDTYELDNQGNRTYTYTITSDVTIAEDFRTKEINRIYVKVPKGNASAYWEGLRIIPVNRITQSKAETAESVTEFAEPMEVRQNIDEYILYYFDIPAGNHSFNLYPQNSTTSSRIFSYEIVGKEGEKENYQNCWLINNTENNTDANGDWVSATVTLNTTDIGQYGVYVDGIYVYENNKDGYLTNITNIPYGTQLQVLEGEPGDNAYTGYVGIIENGKVKQKFTFDGNPEDNLVTIEGDVSFDDLFVTKPNQIIYIGIPEDDTFNSWRTCNKDGHSTHELDVFIWHHSPYDMTPKKQNLIHKSEIIEIGNTKYYKFCLPEGFHAFNFECKTAGGDNDPAHAGTKQQTRPLISTTNCFLLNGETNSSGQFLGEWMGSQVILDAFPHGYYGFTCNGQQYTSDYNIEQTIDIPFGAEIQLNDVSIESEYYGKYQRFTTDLVGVFNGGGIEGINNLNHTIYGEVNFAANSVINKPCTVYLHIPQDLISQWNNESNNGKKNYIYAHQFEDMYNDGVGGKLVELKQVQFTQSTSAGEYWMGVIPANVAHSFYFERKTAADGSVVNQTISFRYACPFDENICYTIREKDEKWIGTWGPLPNCTVTLGWCPIGKYGVRYNGQAYYSKTSENTSFEVPFGSQVTLIEGKPVVDIYDGGIISSVKINTKDVNERLDLNQPYTVTSDVLFDDNFVTKKEHVFYLGVPDNLAEWNQSGAEYYIWTHDRAGSFDMLGDKCHGTHVPEYDGNGYKYYKFTLQAKRNEFRFEHKEPNTENPTGNNSNTTLARSTTLTYQVPITNENCYKLNGSYYTSGDYDYYQGSWETLPARVGDYRLLYAEKELIKTHEEGEAEDWETAFHTVYSHPSDIIRKGVDSQTVSLHINTSQKRGNKSVHPMVILQEYNGTSWVDIEAHTVLPLKATGNMAMLPGRKKAYGELPFYSNGIDKIKNDTTFAYKGYPGSGVWDFLVTQGVDRQSNTVSLDLKNIERYEGTYYIRTSNALGQWANYTYPDNHMTLSSYSLHHRNFSHYYCKWVDLDKHSSNVKFIVANDYGSAISKELAEDSYTTGDGVISENANIRWSWNVVDNKVSRAYIQGTWNTEESPKRLDNIVAIYKTSGSASESRVLLDDTGDWIYSKDISNVQVGSELVSLTAKYPSSALDPQVFAEDIKMLIGDIATNPNKYKVRILYDFKIDKTLVALVPNENEANIGIDVLIQRIDQNPATQVQASAAVHNEDGATVYAMMTFNKDKLINGNLSDQRRFTYWISFPFNVNIDDVFGFSEYGKQWRIREYDGASRAVNGYNGSQTYWKYIDVNTTKVLEANKGYILVLNAKLRDPNHSAYTNRDQLSLYFPSASKITDINDGLTQTTAVVDRKEGAAAKKDWNWNMIGVPSYANKNWTIRQNDLYYFFEYNLDRDSYEVCWAGKEQVFNSMFSYMVQFAGTIDWKNQLTQSGEFPQQMAAKKSAASTHVLRLDLMHNAQREDKTYIQLLDEKATADFDMNLDLTKMVNDNANIYSLAGNHQLAANVLPMEATTVPLGVIIKTAGEYTFAMPDGTDGIVAELIDYQTNTRTNLALEDYKVTLPAGTNHTRFAISLQPDKTVTGIEDEHWTADGTQVRKFLIDGRLYMLKDGVLYDAQGREIVNN